MTTSPFHPHKAQIRLATPDDLDTLCAFYQKVIAHLDTRTNFPLWHWGVHPNEQMLEDAIKNKEILVLIQDDQLIGALRVNQELEGEEDVTWIGSSPYCIHLFAVDPSLGGQGVSDWFLGQIMEKYRNSDADSLRLNLISGNKPARSLYARNGFESRGEIEYFLEAEGTLPFELMEHVFD